MCEDVQLIKDSMEMSGVLSKYDPKSYESMLELCKTYNKSVDAYLKVRYLLLIKQHTLSSGNIT